MSTDEKHCYFFIIRAIRVIRGLRTLVETLRFALGTWTWDFEATSRETLNEDQITSIL